MNQRYYGLLIAVTSARGSLTATQQRISREPCGDSSFHVGNYQVDTSLRRTAYGGTYLVTARSTTHLECYSFARPSPIGSTSGAGARTVRTHTEDDPELGACRGHV